MRGRPNTIDFPTRDELDDGLDIEMRVFIPSTVNVNKKLSSADFKKRIQESVRFFTQLFGGSTRYAGVGSYTVQKNHGVVSEQVAIIEVFTNSDAWKKHDVAVKNWLLEKKKNWGQESMGFEFEGRLVFV